jgi:flagellar motility protein MotE (MotC chaperone)
MNAFMGINRERGSVAGWVVGIIVFLVLAGGAYAVLINYGVAKPPAALAAQPWMQKILPQTVGTELPPDQQAPVEITSAEYLKQQVIVLNAQHEQDLSTIEGLKADSDEKDRTIKDREDEIARLRDAVNLASSKSINNVALIYENMDPQEAATILADMGADKASLIIGAMKEKKSAAVLALMDPAMATQITQILAGFQPNPAAPAMPNPATPTPPTGGGSDGGTSPNPGTPGPLPGQGQA